MAERRAAPIRVMLVDSHLIYRRGLAEMLKQFEDLAVVAEASSAASAAVRARKTQPQVVLLGDEVSDSDLPDAVHTILSAAPDAAVALLAERFDESVFAAVRAGALGYFFKTAGMQWLHDGVYGLSRGGTAVTPLLAGRILDELGRFGAWRSGFGAWWGALSDREFAILRYVDNGWSTDRIAEKLEITPYMVQALLRATLDVLHHLSPGPDDDGGDFSGDRAPRPRPGGSPVRVASVALPLPEPEQTPLPGWLVRAFPDGFPQE
ncbi:MAG TPA: response regulator transcription factor [Dehalococcoidia bacterium]|nr:response regulator transcription factor [Dehalococcoidia bacterium]